MRAVIANGMFPAHALAWAIGLNAFYLTVLVFWFHMMFATCKDKGLLVRVGE
jgi:ABC-2 type transport system permease protein